MIKCPNCGSTAQVKIINKEATMSADITITHSDCECGCGTSFTYSEGLNEFLETIKTRYSDVKKGK